MSAERRAHRYPLEAVHRREGWRLESLQAELGAAARRLGEAGEQYEACCRRQRIAAQAARSDANAVIDPVLARGRLAYLGQAQARAASASTMAACRTRFSGTFASRAMRRQSSCSGAMLMISPPSRPTFTRV